MNRVLAAVISVWALGCTGQVVQPDEPVTESDTVAVDPWWLGDSASCQYTSADRNVQMYNTALGDTRVYDNFSGTGYRSNSEECPFAFVVDYWMPNPAGTQWERGWNWMWFHAAPQDISQEDCASTWSNVQVFSSYASDPYNFVKIRHINRWGSWNGSYCSLGPLNNQWRDGTHGITRIVSQTGIGWNFATNHDNYVVTNIEPTSL